MRIGDDNLFEISCRELISLVFSSLLKLTLLQALNPLQLGVLTRYPRVLESITLFAYLIIV